MELIDRQAAIDALKRYSLGETDAVKLEMRMYDYLKRVASAQPEIIRCKDCKYHDENKILDSSNSKIGWHPCDTVVTNNNWFCGDGERKDG